VSKSEKMWGEREKESFKWKEGLFVLDREWDLCGICAWDFSSGIKPQPSAIPSPLDDGDTQQGKAREGFGRSTSHACNAQADLDQAYLEPKPPEAYDS
jgi:hypothetical protein